MYYQEIADIVGSTSKMREERRQEQSLYQIQIENVTRRVQENDGRTKLLMKRYLNIFYMFRFLHVELKLNNNLFKNLY